MDSSSSVALALCSSEKSPEPNTSYGLHATKWPVEVDLEEAVQDLSYHRCSISQELELHSSGEGPVNGSDRTEIDEFVRVLVSCEEQACDLLKHLDVWETGQHAVRSMATIHLLEEDTAPTIPPNIISLGEWNPDSEEVDKGPKIASVEVVEGDPNVPLQTRAISLEGVNANIEKWRWSIEVEYRSLIQDTEAIEPLSEEAFQNLCKSHVVELIPGKSVDTIKAYSGRLKTRGVGCGNYQHGEKRTNTDTFSGGIDAHSLLLLIRNAALRQWSAGTLDVPTALPFLNVDIVKTNKEVIVVKVPTVFRMIGIKEKYWRVHKALYSLDVSPRSWNLSRNGTLRKVDRLVPKKPTPVQSELPKGPDSEAAVLMLV